ncbi:MAG: hypothetical protein AAB849_00625 [Patescibacteria group bacterium]
MAEVKRKRNESFEALFRRFQDKIRQSGKILQAKKIRFHAPQLNKNRRRKSAIEKSRRTNLREYLIKVGKLKDEKPTFRR